MGNEKGGLSLPKTYFGVAVQLAIAPFGPISTADESSGASGERAGRSARGTVLGTAIRVVT